MQLQMKNETNPITETPLRDCPLVPLNASNLNQIVGSGDRESRDAESELAMANQIQIPTLTVNVSSQGGVQQQSTIKCTIEYRISTYSHGILMVWLAIEMNLSTYQITTHMMRKYYLKQEPAI